MATAQLLYASIGCRSLEESAKFYSSMLGAQRIATPNLGTPQLWMTIGDRELRLHESRVQPLLRQHLVFLVDSLEEAYRQALAFNCLDSEFVGQPLWRTESGEGILYVRDPSHHLLALHAPDIEVLSTGLRDKCVLWVEGHSAN